MENIVSAIGHDSLVSNTLRQMQLERQSWGDDPDFQTNVPRISTMTIVCELVTSSGQLVHIDINKLADNWNTLAEDILIEGPGGVKYTKRGNLVKRFLNQASIFLEKENRSETRKCVKLFSNGKLHVVGARSIEEAEETLHTVLEMAASADGALPCSTAECSLCNMKVAMINSHFQLFDNQPLEASQMRGLDLYKLHELITSEYCGLARYDPSVYPGINFKISNLQHPVSCFIFNSGKIIMTGTRSIQSIASAYSLLNTIIRSKKDLVLTFRQKNKRKI